MLSSTASLDALRVRTQRSIAVRVIRPVMGDTSTPIWMNDGDLHKAGDLAHNKPGTWFGNRLAGLNFNREVFR